MRKTKKEEKKKAAKDKKDKKKKKKKDKKEKKDKEEKKAAKDKKEPVVVPARVITLGALREELERYCTIQEITTQHENPWATDPHPRRPATWVAPSQHSPNGKRTSFAGSSSERLKAAVCENLKRRLKNVPTKMPRQLKRRSTKRQKPRRKKNKARPATKDRRNKAKRDKRRAETPEQASARREKETTARRVKTEGTGGFSGKGPTGTWSAQTGA